MAIFEKDVEKWEEVLDIMINHSKLSSWVPQIIWRSGMTDRAGLRIVNLVNKGIMKKSDFAMFIYGRLGTRLSDQVFLEWMKLLSNNPTKDELMIAVPLFAEYYASKEPKHALPYDITLQLICNDLLFDDNSSERNRWMDEHFWTEIAEKFVEQFPDKSSILADKMLQNMDKENNILDGYHSETLEVLDLMSNLNPESLWESIKKYIGPTLDRRAFRILSWMRGEETEGNNGTILNKIPFEKIVEWIEIDRDERAPYLARFVPKDLAHGQRCIAMDLLAKYGDKEDVRNELHVNFSNESWTGSGADYYSEKKELMIKFRENESNENVRKWLDEYIAFLDENIERMKGMEEREF